MEQQILAVDDELHMLKLLERIIKERTEYSISTTNNSLEVPKILKERQFDLIITDWKMPGLDGIEILRLVKENNRKEEVIIITAFGTTENFAEAMMLGAIDYINKPFKMERIIRSVEKAMEFRRTRRDAELVKNLLSREPVEDAIVAFKDEYIRRLAERYQGEETLMAKQSGLSEEQISSFLKGKEIFKNNSKIKS